MSTQHTDTGQVRLSGSKAWLWLALAVLICYANALNGDFQFDDYKVIVDNPNVHSWNAWSSLAGGGIRPLLKLSYTLNWMYVPGSLGYHVVNVLIHWGNACLVWGLAQSLVRMFSLQRQAPYAPILSALLFAVHPAHTEAVSYVCGRSTSLMTLFYLGGLLAYAQGRAHNRRWMVFGLTPLMFIAALGVKETAVTFPAALLLWDLACKRTWRSQLQAQWPSWTVLLLGAAYFLLSTRYTAHMQRSVELNSMVGNAATQVVALTYLLQQWAWPFWLNIDPDLTLRQDFEGLGLQLVVLSSMVLAAVVCPCRRPWIRWALLWALLQLVPLYLFLPRLDIANDRQLYLADWPLGWILAVESARWMQLAVFRAAVVSFVLTLAGLTALRNEDYATEISLWEATVQLSPGKARVHNNLGYAYLLAGRKAEARQAFETALLLDPKHIKARYNLERAKQP